MRALFVDTGFWIAINSSRDVNHNIAVELASKLGGCRIVTSQMVLTEFLTDFGTRYSHLRMAAAQFVRDMEQDSTITIVDSTPDLFESALTLYERRPDKQWSLTDCASFVICEEQGISEALAFDHHYEQAGIVALMRDK